MSELIKTLPNNNKENPTQNEYEILDVYFPPAHSFDIRYIKMSILFAFLSIIIIIVRELYLMKIPLNLYITTSFIVTFIISFLILTFF